MLCVRWHLSNPLDYRDLKEMMLDRGLDVDHTTIYRWVQSYSKEFDKRVIAKEEGFMLPKLLVLLPLNASTIFILWMWANT